MISLNEFGKPYETEYNDMSISLYLWFEVLQQCIFFLGWQEDNGFIIFAASLPFTLHNDILKIERR